MPLDRDGRRKPFTLDSVPLLWLFLPAVAAILVLRPTLQPRCPELPGKAVRVAGVITGCRDTSGGRSVTLRVDSLGGRPVASFQAAIQLATYAKPDFRLTPLPGHRLAVTAQLEPLSGAPSPLPDCQTWQQSYLRKGIVASALVDSDTLLLAHAPAPGVRAAMDRLRHRQVERLLASGLDEPTALFLAAALLGDTSAFPELTRHEMARAGMAHVLALSGLHLGIIVWLMGLLLVPLSLMSLHRWRMGALIALTWGYVLLTGMPVSLLRAAIMITAALVGRMLSEHNSQLNALLLAALVILAFSPTALFDAGFQLTFAATAGILLATGGMTFTSWRGSFVMSLIVISVTATLSTAVLSLWYFHRVSPAFLLGNAVAAVALAPLLAAGLLMLVCLDFGLSTSWLEPVADRLHAFLAWGARESALIGGDTWHDVWLTPAAALLLGLATLLLLLSLRLRRWPAGVMALMLAAGGVLLDTQPTEAATEAVFTPDSRHALLVCRRADTLWALPRQPSRLGAETVEEVSRIYEPYLSRRRIAAVAVMPDTFNAGRAFARRGPLMAIGGRLWHVQGHYGAPAPGLAVDRLAVGDGFRGDVVELARSVGADTVVLLPDLNAHLRTRYARELEENGVASSITQL